MQISLISQIYNSIMDKVKNLHNLRNLHAQINTCWSLSHADLADFADIYNGWRQSTIEALVLWFK